MQLLEKQIFTTSIFAGEVQSVDNVKIVEEVYQLRQKDPGRKMPKHTGWHSNQITVSDVEKTTEILKVVKQIYSSAQEVATTMGYPNELIFNTCWINVNNPGNFNEAHRHPSTHLSAVYYIKAEQNSGNISFIRDGRLEDYFPPSSNPNSHNYPRVSEEAKTNNFYIFPSYLDHKVDPNFSDQERISMAFNFTFGNNL